MGEIVELGEYGTRFTEDPHPVYAELRARGPVHRVRLPPPMAHHETWLVVGYEEARAALADGRLAKDVSKTGFTPLDEELIGKYLLVADPPQHTRLRRLIAREFTGRRVERLRPRVREITGSLLDAMLPQGRADLVESFAFPLPITVICELLGVPELDRKLFRALSTETVAPTSAESEHDAIVRLAAYLDELIEDKRCSPPADDLLSDLIRTTDEDGDRLSARELRGMAYVLLLAGHETTVNLIANGVHALLAHPGQLAALRADMTLLDGAVEEILRYEGPVENATFRYAAEPLDIAGTAIAAGDPVMIGLTAADRDGTRFPAPDRFDIRRAPQGHLAFGHGLHYCLGAPLARLEARIALRALLERCPDLALDGRPGDWLPGTLIRGVRSLPVRW
ncbi:cytochrome P450 family protein [Streptomyces poonensis]|uniref:Cytochrome P450 n=1 Tax=Streptomyces poonensis TaxID=68255 RepID=A0A918QCG6_9ACTN|nr:cytochrome P450 [Streptomyces poonensis]GGZ39773.1 cytochrome P450 [Streptomyces poonensis]GLJ92908.1 cytochrome P450 [Streptomyces poonensis]